MRKAIGLGFAWALIPLTSGLLCGLKYSREIVGHQPAGSGGWLDLRGLDPLNFAFQDAFVAILFSIAACLLYAVLLGVSTAAFKSLRITAPASAVCAAVITVGYSLNIILAELGERKGVAQASDAKSSMQEKAWATADLGCNEAFIHMGWVSYPHADHPPKGSGCSGRFHVATDSIEAVFNYYLSRANYWVEDGDQIWCVEQNEGQTFLVRLEKKNPPGVQYEVVASDRRLANQGTTSWPISSSPPPLRDLGHLAYPNGERQDRPGTTAFLTKDSVEQASAFYRQLEASSVGTTSWERAYVTPIDDRQAYVLIKPNAGGDGSSPSDTVVEIYVR